MCSSGTKTVAAKRFGRWKSSTRGRVKPKRPPLSPALSVMAYQEKQLQEISKKFQIYGEILHAETLKIGHINETYTATYDQGGTRVRYIHQKLNKNVFKNPNAVMKNVMRVTTHIRKKLEAQNVRDLTRRSLVVIPARDGKSFFENGDSEVWRTFVFIEGVETYEAVQSPAQAF